MSSQALTPIPPALGDYARRKATLRHRWWYEAIIDDMLANPHDTLKVRAARLGYSERWLSTVTNSDMFKAAYADRREKFSAALNHSLSHKIGKVADAGLDIMLEQLEKKRDALPFAAVAETTLSVLSRLGYAEPAKPGVQVNVQQNAPPAIGPVSAEALSNARNKITELENQTREAGAQPPAREVIVEVLPPEVSSPAPKADLPEPHE